MEKKGIDSSSSEDEECTKALKESIDPDFFQQSLLQSKNDVTKSNKNSNSNIPNNTSKIGNSNREDYLGHGLSETFKRFVAKKLDKKLSVDIIMENDSLAPVTMKEDSKESEGIKLFSSSQSTIKKIEEIKQSPLKSKKKKYNNEKLILKQSSEVVVEPETILSKDEVKHWVNRKSSKIFHYRKHKNQFLLTESENSGLTTSESVEKKSADEAHLTSVSIN